jgi:serine/threonine protein kinase
MCPKTPPSLTAFRIEARVMADLEHPGIVRVSNFGEDQGRHYLVMDYVEGPDGAPRTLDDELAWGKKLPEHVVLNMAIQLCDALEYAHTFPAGAIIHRDLKPGNILLQKAEQKTGPAPVPAPAGPEPELRVKIADFGLARIIGTDYIKAVIDRSTHLTVMPLRPTAGDAQATEINTGGAARCRCWAPTIT